MVVFLASLLAGAGLDAADKLASVIGLFVGLGSLAVAVLALLGRRRPAAVDSSGQVDDGSPRQVVTDSSIGGDNIQIGYARDVSIHREG
ncbi:hypothetical protein [Micromonospora sp. DT231]|uniref:hypothetical protein n=1 Tax=Micromonospora sp. DT231 TaxID=3416526 RepID=UPI003CEBDC16